MNAAERLVELYFRFCRKCFTTTDVKVEKGNNLQFDMIAVSILGRKVKAVYRVEVNVTHCLQHCPTKRKLFRNWGHKFAGKPWKSSRFRNRDSVAIYQAYRGLGLNISKIHRVYCCWVVPKGDTDEIISEYYEKRGIQIEILSLRDEVLPELRKKVGSSNYDDELLRTVSLLGVAEKQVPKPNEKLNAI